MKTVFENGILSYVEWGIDEIKSVLCGEKRAGRRKSAERMYLINVERVMDS